MKSENKSSTDIHSPFVAQREVLDSGFSKGWGFHFPPIEDYWIDCHNHLVGGKQHGELHRMIEDWYVRMSSSRLGKILVIAEGTDAFDVYKDVSKQDKRFGWMLWLPYDKPDAELLQKALDNGAVGLKLHNAQIMEGEAAPEQWLSDEWGKVFELVEKSGIPILWHVTQRVSYSPYHGGGYNSYWAKGQKKGIRFNNEDLLQISLKLLKTYPKMKIIGAHQLHVGLERLSSLLDEYKNLSFDTSCGFVLRPEDDFFEADREIFWDFFVKYQDRIVFGTDTFITPENIDNDAVHTFLTHTRFIKKLRLPYDVLQKIAYENAERIFGMEPLMEINKGPSML
jgi:predicted TIM-barrel fold metal-dependent hydrolase